MRGDSPTPRATSPALKLYALALLLYPADFRRRFAADMVRDARDTLADIRLHGSSRDVRAFWLRLAADVAVTVVTQRAGTRAPAVVLFVVGVAFGASGIARRLAVHGRWVPPSSTADLELLTLLMLVSAVLLVIVATIVFTSWFAHRTLQRHRR